MLEDEVQIQKDYDEYGVVYQDTYKKYWKDNPRPKPPKQSTLSTYSFEDYKKAKVKWDEEEDKYIKPFTDRSISELLKIMNFKNINVKPWTSNLIRFVWKLPFCFFYCAKIIPFRNNDYLKFLPNFLKGKSKTLVAVCQKN